MENDFSSRNFNKIDVFTNILLNFNMYGKFIILIYCENKIVNIQYFLLRISKKNRAINANTFIALLRYFILFLLFH